MRVGRNGAPLNGTGRFALSLRVAQIVNRSRHRLDGAFDFRFSLGSSAGMGSLSFRSGGG
jgi:hypothetical protein